jgi:hypothetical protein
MADPKKYRDEAERLRKEAAGAAERQSFKKCAIRKGEARSLLLNLTLKARLIPARVKVG